MAPFKLKFRMGSSRSTSQEHDPDPQVNEALLNHHSSIGASSSTINSADCNSLGSMGNNSSERKSLLPSKTNSLRLGYLNSNLAQCISESSATDTDSVPTTPPPSYEHVLEENHRLSSNFERKHYRQRSVDSNRSQSQTSRRSSVTHSRNSVNLSAALEHLELSSNTCTDPDCEQNQNYNLQTNHQNFELIHTSHNQEDSLRSDNNEDGEIGINENNDRENNEDNVGNQRNLETHTNMTTPDLRENLLEECTDENCDGNCGLSVASANNKGSGGGGKGTSNNGAGFYDPLLNHHEYYNEVAHYNEQEQGGGAGGGSTMQSDYICNDSDSWNDGGDNWNMQQSQQQQQQQQHEHQRQVQQAQLEDCTNALTAELMSNKSSKEIYKDLAKQWGITCKMSDGCRCMDCQSNYFDCEFDDNEHQKTDGGLGAGTPMFISEVMQGSACTIL